MAGSFEQRHAREFVGTYRPRIDGPEKAGGTAEYLDDLAMSIRFPGLLHAKILRSPYPHARIRHLDTSRAEALPGVFGILTYADPEVAGLKPTTSAWTSANTASYDKMYYPSLRDRRVLADTATWAGDKFGVAVAAETEALAVEALGLLEIDWEELPFSLDVAEALGEGVPAIHPEINPDGNVLPCEPIGGPQCFVDKGQVDSAFTECDVVVEVGSRHHRANQAVLDTRGCFAYWNRDQLVFYTNYYQADQTRMYLAQMLGLPLNKVRVINPYAGAQFGRCNAGEQPFFVTVALLAKRTGRPVKYKMSLEEDFHDTRNSIGYVAKVGAVADGRIVAAHFQAVGDAGGYADHTMAAVKIVVKWDCMEALLAKIPNLRMDSWVVYTNKIPGNCMRAIGNIQLNMVLGLAIDTLAEDLGLDPLDVALTNLAHEWESLPSASLDAVLAAGAERIGWADRGAPGAGPWIEGSKKRGLGFSCHNSWHAAWQEQIRGDIQTTVTVNPDLSVNLQAPMVETGVGSNSCVVFACAEALKFIGVRPEDVHWTSRTDTETGLKDMVQTDSSVSYLQAELMPLVAEEVAEKIRQKAAVGLEAAPHELSVADGRVFVTANPSRGSTVREVLWDDTLVPITVTVSKNAPEEVAGTPFAATFAEVEVDTATGQVEVTRLVVVHDAGTVMYASGAEGQQIGGQCTGVGEALYEEIVYDRATGVPLNFNFVDYGFPTMMDFPPVDPVLLEVWRGAGEYGACGIGEGAPTSTPRAILNAVYNAVGVRIDDIPLKPEKVLSALSMQAAVGAGPGAQPYAQRLLDDIRADVEAASCVADACGIAELPSEPTGEGSA
ncbi:MAG: xanthine dehydrogenase family protein molybdopterin-binding subunit [Thermoleophilia bacterium]